jgi:L-ascorbate metabolism protein UlaG (beta-lactamase superfamily)
MCGFGIIDLAFIPIGGKYTMDVEEAAAAALAIKPGAVIPIHHLGESPEEFKDRVESQADISVVVLGIGDVFRLD